MNGEEISTLIRDIRNLYPKNIRIFSEKALEKYIVLWQNILC